MHVCCLEWTRSRQRLLLLVLLCILLGFPHVRAKKMCFGQPGDINIGASFSMTEITSSKKATVEGWCEGTVPKIFSPETQALVFIVEKINKAGLLPNNLTLGFFFLDSCDPSMSVTYPTLSFLPRTHCECGQGLSPRKEDCKTQGNSAQDYYHFDVIGVLGPKYSSHTLSMGTLLSTARVPLISPYATHDLLSQNPWFFRTVPPSRFTVKGLVMVIQHFHWSYVSVVYSRTDYSVSIFNFFRMKLKEEHICLAATVEISMNLSDSKADEVIKVLLSYRASVVILMTYDRETAQVMTAARRSGQTKRLVWVGSGAWFPDLLANEHPHLASILNRSLVVSFSGPDSSGFQAWMGSRKPVDTDDPWFAENWEKQFGCSLKKGTCNSSTTFADSPGRSYHYLAVFFDAALMLANASARVLRSAECKGKLNAASARTCISGSRLREELLATRQEGYSGMVQVDANGDRLGKFRLTQTLFTRLRNGTIRPEVKVVAKIDTSTSDLVVKEEVTWSAGQLNQSWLGTPLSYCSDACGAREALVRQEVECCWRCQPCAVYERLNPTRTKCEPCPALHWPYNVSRCEPITPEEARLAGALGIAVCTLSIFLLCVCCCMGVCYVVKRNARVIKASSVGLSCVMLLGLVTGLVAAVTILLPPNDVLCRVTFFIFNMSFTLVYGPLAVRTYRIHDIFQKSMMAIHVKGISQQRHQVLISSGLVFFQVVICVLLMLWYRDWSLLSQSSPKDEYVERTCNYSQARWIATLGYNMLLVAACLFWAFKSRRLPNNFNESRFITLCVMSTSCILLCFIPAYLASSTNVQRIEVLPLILLIHHTVALVFLFMPKVYAAFFKAEKKVGPVYFHPSRIRLRKEEKVQIDKSSPQSCLYNSRPFSSPYRSSKEKSSNVKWATVT